MVLLSDLSSDQNKEILEKGSFTYLFSKDFEPIRACYGCFGCWLKTPGECLTIDETKNLRKSVVSSDTFIIVSEIIYGGYSPFIKRIHDRLLPNLSPYFKVVNKETHHQGRYDKYPKLIVIGYSKDNSKNEIETFKKLVNANSINLQMEDYDCYIASNLDEVKVFLSQISEVR